MEKIKVYSLDLFGSVFTQTELLVLKKIQEELTDGTYSGKIGKYGKFT